LPPALGSAGHRPHPARRRARRMRADRNVRRRDPQLRARRNRDRVSGSSRSLNKRAACDKLQTTAATDRSRFDASARISAHGRHPLRAGSATAAPTTAAATPNRAAESRLPRKRRQFLLSGEMRAARRQQGPTVDSKPVMGCAHRRPGPLGSVQTLRPRSPR
jgi:hypothetical protein